MKFKQLGRISAAAVLSLTSLLTITTPIVHAAGATCVWTGATDLNLGTATNWTTCAGVAPTVTDIISFGQAPSIAQINLVNNLGHPVAGVVSNAVSTSSNYHFDTLALSSGASISAVGGTTCNPTFAQLTFNTLTDTGSLFVNDDVASLINTTALTVGGSLTIANAYGYGYLSVKPGSAVTGQVIVSSPVIETSATGCSAGGAGGGLSTGSNFLGFTLNGLTVQNGSSTGIVSASYPITLGGGNGTVTPLLNFYSGLNSDQSAYVDTTYTLSGAITLLNDAQIYTTDKTTVNVAGSINGAAYAITNAVYNEGTLNINPSANTSKTTTGVQVNPVKVTIVTDDQSANVYSVYNNQTLQDDGKTGYVNLSKGATLQGSGQVNGFYANAGSILSPGHSPGCINSTQNVTIYGTYKVDIGGTIPCSGYDQLNVIGTVTLSNSSGNAGILTAAPYNGYVPKVGEAYTIISNDGTDVVIGTFAGIAEGGAYTNQGVTYSVTYKGGDGNDVVLTVTKVDASALPKKPNTGLLLVAAHPMISLGASVIAAGLLYGASRRVKTVRR
jgi:hypothetical protein